MPQHVTEAMEISRRATISASGDISVSLSRFRKVPGARVNALHALPNVDDNAYYYYACCDACAVPVRTRVYLWGGSVASLNIFILIMFNQIPGLLFAGYRPGSRAANAHAH